MDALGGLIFVAAIGFLIFMFSRVVKAFIEMVWTNVCEETTQAFSKPVTEQEYREMNDLLTEYLSYYTQLSKKGKAKFLKRLARIKRVKHFIPMEGMNITEEVKTLLSGALVQITFGLKRYTISYFKRFYIYPSVFYSELLRTNVKGLTSGVGNVLISWEDFIQGYDIPDDNLNLGLHELSHALKLNVMRGDSFDKQFAKFFYQWEKVGFKEFNKLKLGKSDILRKYGSTNMVEFFAVCVETFFESPAAFKNSKPELYRYFVNILNQDPLRKGFDYVPLK